MEEIDPVDMCALYRSWDTDLQLTVIDWDYNQSVKQSVGAKVLAGL